MAGPCAGEGNRQATVSPLHSTRGLVEPFPPGCVFSRLSGTKQHHSFCRKPLHALDSPRHLSFFPLLLYSFAKWRIGVTAGVEDVWALWPCRCCHVPPSSSLFFAGRCKALGRRSSQTVCRIPEFLILVVMVSSQPVILCMRRELFFTMCISFSPLRFHLIF